jgi:hypothetical protein
MTVTENLVFDSLHRRMRALHSLYPDALANMDIDQVHHVEREGVVPIAFSLFQEANLIDDPCLLMTGPPPIWDATWEERVRPAMANDGKHRSVAEVVHQRIGDCEAFGEYLPAVFDRTEAWLGRRRRGIE